MATTAPSSQKFANVSFALHDGEEPLLLFHLPIRPEELTRAEPSRVSVVNSLDGAWVDSFGRGLSNITLSGNTGWRIRNDKDGIANFVQLRDEIIHKWHTLRTDRIKNGKDPSEVRLIFIDPINGQYVADVVPTNFTLRRSKSQPLLLMYSIALTAVNDKAFNPYPWLMDEVNPTNDPAASLVSMSDSIKDIKSLQAKLRDAKSKIGAFGATVNQWTADTFGPVMAMANEVITTANDAKAVISEASQVAVDLATDLSAVGGKLWAGVAAVTSLPNAIKADVMRIKGAFSNLHCVLANGYQSANASATSYADMYGASNCSSTLGGSPRSKLKDINPFETAVAKAKVSVSDSASKAIGAVKQLDLPTQAVNAGDLASHAKAMMGGIKCL